MARRRGNRQILVPQAAGALDAMKMDKFEAAQELGVPLKRGYNGQLTTEDAGRVGGKIGGQLVKELIMRAQRQLSNQLEGGEALDQRR